MTARMTVLLFGAALFVALPAYAQLSSSFQIPGLANALSIEVSPRYPGPNASVQVTAESSYLNLPQSDITWYVNGAQVAEGTGATSVTVQLGGLGKETDVNVTADGIDGSASAQAALIPNRIDLLWESDSYTPPFYRGRALPSAGTSLRLQAIAHFARADGTEIPASQISYTWKRDGEVIGNISGLGDSSVTIDAALLHSSEVISVDAISQDGTQSGEAGATIPSTKPVLTLYEDHPVFGILYGNALTDQASVSESEMAFAAVPYFASAQNANDPLFEYDWQVNDQGIASDPKNPSEITVNAQNSNGLALITLDLTHAKNIFLDISGVWNVLLSGGASAPNPFTSTRQ